MIKLQKINTHFGEIILSNFPNPPPPIDTVLILTYPHLVFVFVYNQLNILLVSLHLVTSDPISIFVGFFLLSTTPSSI